MNGQVDPLLFACPACSRDECTACRELTDGIFCVHLCWWTLLTDWGFWQ